MKRYEVWVRYEGGVPAPSRTVNYGYWFKSKALQERDNMNRFHWALQGIRNKPPVMEFYVINSKTGEEV